MAHTYDAAALYAPGYPIYMNLHGKRVVVIGGGAVAQRKIETLLEYGAEVHVVALQPNDRVRELAQQGAISLLERAYETGDLAGAFLVFSACGDTSSEDAICAEAAALGCPINVADVPERCDFIVPSIVSRGQLQIAISTSGAAPTEAKKIRKRLESDYDESWGPYLDLLSQLRLVIKDRVKGPESARSPLYAAAAAAGWRERLAAGETISIEDAFAEACERAGVEV